MSNKTYKTEPTWFDNFAAFWIIDKETKEHIALALGTTRDKAAINCATIVRSLEMQSPPPEGNTPASEQGEGNYWYNDTEFPGQKVRMDGIREFIIDSNFGLSEKQLFDLLKGIGYWHLHRIAASQSPPSLPEAEKANELVEALEFTKGQVQDMDKWNQEAKKELADIKSYIANLRGEALKDHSENTALLVFVQKLEESFTWIKNVK